MSQKRVNTILLTGIATEEIRPYSHAWKDVTNTGRELKLISSLKLCKEKKMRLLYIVLVTIGLLSCGIEENAPIAPAPVVNVEPPEVTIQPTEVTVQPPDITIQPTEVTVQPPTVNVHPPAVTVQPPTVNVLPPDADSTPPIILSGTVTHGEDNVNPDLINTAGLQFHFNEAVTGTIKLTDTAGVNLNWFSNVAGQTAHLIPFAGQQLSRGQTYIIEIAVADAAGNPMRRAFQFVTAIKE